MTHLPFIEIHFVCMFNWKNSGNYLLFNWFYSIIQLFTFINLFRYKWKICELHIVRDRILKNVPLGAICVKPKINYVNPKNNNNNKIMKFIFIEYWKIPKLSQTAIGYNSAKKKLKKKNKLPSCFFIKDNNRPIEMMIEISAIWPEVILYASRKTSILIKMPFIYY